MPDAAGKGADLGVVALHRCDEVTPGHRDAVLGAFELRLQGKEVLVGFELRVALGDRHQPAEGAGQLVLCLLELLQLLRIVEGIGIDLDRGRPGPRLDHRGEGFLLLAREALDRFDQVGNQVGAPLVLVLYLRPGRFHLLVVTRNVVDAAAGQQPGHEDHNRQLPGVSKTLRLHDALVHSVNQYADKNSQGP